MRFEDRELPARAMFRHIVAWRTARQEQQRDDERNHGEAPDDGTAAARWDMPQETRNGIRGQTKSTGARGLTA